MEIDTPMFRQRSWPFRRNADRQMEVSAGIDLLQCYALHCVGIGFSVRRWDRWNAEICVREGDDQLDRISKIFGCDLARNVIPIERECNQGQSVSQRRPMFRFSGWISNADYDGRRRLFMLFINDRCVECDPLKRAVDAVYASVLPKKVSFVYVSLHLPLLHVDVNVHPTKREVDFRCLRSSARILKVTMDYEFLVSGSTCVLQYTNIA